MLASVRVSRSGLSTVSSVARTSASACAATRSFRSAPTLPALFALSSPSSLSFRPVAALGRATRTLATMSQPQQGAKLIDGNATAA